MLLTLLTMIPAIVLSMTPFVRLLIVFHFLRQALGTQTTPSNQTLIGLSLILTFFLMQPVGAAIYQEAMVPLRRRAHHDDDSAGSRGRPHAAFHAQVRAGKRSGAVCRTGARSAAGRNRRIWACALLRPPICSVNCRWDFVLARLCFFPFLVIDLVTAAVTTSIGMMQLPPVIISTPLKILLFVVVDGWNLLIGSLMRSFS